MYDYLSNIWTLTQVLVEYFVHHTDSISKTLFFCSVVLFSLVCTCARALSTYMNVSVSLIGCTSEKRLRSSRCFAAGWIWYWRSRQHLSQASISNLSWTLGREYYKPIASSTCGCLHNMLNMLTIQNNRFWLGFFISLEHNRKCQILSFLWHFLKISFLGLYW